MAENNDDNINIINNSNLGNNNNNNINIISNSNLGNDANDNIIGSYNYINYIINISNIVNEYNQNGADDDTENGAGDDADDDAGDGGASVVVSTSVENNVINEKLIEIMSNAIEIMFTGIPDEYTQILEQCLLGNMRYDDDNLRTTLTYTISQFISRTIVSYEQIVAVILNYASRESDGIYSNNTLFTNNYDLVYEICKEEIHIHLFR